MKKWICSLILVSLLSGCSWEEKEYYPPADYPTLPSFSQEQSPAEQIGQALDKSTQAKDYCLVYGQIVTRDDQKQESLSVLRVQGDRSLLVAPDRQVYTAQGVSHSLDLSSQTVTQQQSGDIHREIYELVPNDGFLDDLCSSGLTASPSHDGSFTYQLSGLTMEELYRLIHGEGESFPDQSDAVGVASVYVDPEGHLARVQFDAYLPSGEVHTLVIAMEEIGTTQVTQPDWVT